MFYSFVLRLFIIIILLKALISNIHTYRILDIPILTFTYSSINKISMILLTVAFLILTVFYVKIEPLNLIIIMNSILITIACFYSLHLNLIENKITKKGISLTNCGIYLWDDIDRVEFNNKHMIVYYKVKTPINKPIKSIKVKLPTEKSGEILKVIESLNKIVINTKS